MFASDIIVEALEVVVQSTGTPSIKRRFQDLTGASLYVAESVDPRLLSAHVESGMAT